MLISLSICRILNHCRLIRLSAKASTVLRKIFERRWSHCSKLVKGNNSIAEQWVLNDAECGKQLLQMCDASTAPKIKEKLQMANHNEWDVTSLAHAINAVSKKIYASSKFNERAKLTTLNPKTNLSTQSDKFAMT
uniref:Uncharacterized protein n=1 Tax=Ditylenchus dipsaci TaxID=166011 RepID=A0A915DV54_9BILA